MENQSSRQIILQNALNLFSQKGFEAVGISEICENSKITKPTLYYFFKSKDGLLEEILKSFLIPLNQNLQEWGKYEANPSEYEKDVYGLLTRICNGLFNFFCQNKDFALFFLGILTLPPNSKTLQVAKPFVDEFNNFFIDEFYKISSFHTNVKGKEVLLGFLFCSQIMASFNLYLKGELDLNEDFSHRLVHQFMHGIYA